MSGPELAWMRFGWIVMFAVLAFVKS